MNIGDKICWTGNFENPSQIRTGTITRMSGDSVWVDNEHKPEDCIYRSYCWPISAEPELREIITETARLKKELDDRMGLIYKLRNRVSRGELK